MIKKYINLLPPEELKVRRQKEFAHQLQFFGVVFLASLVALSALLFSAEVYLKAQVREGAAAVAAATEELATLERSGMQDEIGKINRNLENIQLLQKQQLKLFDAFREFAALLPRGMTVDGFTFTREEKKIEVSGRALTREEVLTLRENLLASQYFKAVNFPLQNLERSRDVEWSYRFYLK